MQRLFRNDLLLSVAIIANLAACASAPAGPEQQSWSVEDLAYLRSPVSASPVSLDGEMATQLDTAYQALRDGYPERARLVSSSLASVLEDAAPAAVLHGQTFLLEARYGDAIKHLAPVVARHPEYAAARYALGRAYDRSGDLVEAHRLLMPLAASNDARGSVRQRVAEMEPRVLEILGRRVEGAAGSRDFESGRLALDRLREIAPGAVGTWSAARSLAASEGDAPAELEALRVLSLAAAVDAEDRRRHGELELEVGEPAEALQIFESLAAESPDDSSLAESLDQAKFAWRLRLLPEKVQELSELPSLTRGDFAALLYWLVPTVRHGSAVRGKIANDVLEHAYRDEIVRIVNLDLLDVDSLHRFYPEKPVRRQTVLAAYLDVIERALGADGCTGVGWSSEEGTCVAAARCRLVADASDCSPQSEVSGAAAVQIGRAALVQLSPQ